MNNHTKILRDNNKGLPVARHFNKPDHSISDLKCVILKGDFSNNAMGTVATLTSLYNVYLLTSVDVVPLIKTAGVVENSGHCTYYIGLKCF